MKIQRLVVLSATLALFAPAVDAQRTPAPSNAELYFISPEDNASVRSPFKCLFGLSNMGVTHAGDTFANSGHHHLLIDVDPPDNANEPIPKDKKHLHFGAGQTEALIDLPPGKHTLQLVLGDADHFVFNPPVMSKQITCGSGRRIEK